MAAASMQDRYGPWAVVTGASDGIGLESARAAAAAGLNLALVARRKPELDRLAAELEKEHGIETRVIPADLAEPEGVGAVLGQTLGLDVGLVIAAAGFGTSGPFVAADIDTEADMIAVNCTAPMVLAHSFGRRMVSRGSGGIVLFSSIVAFQGVARAANYAATKAFIQTLAEGLRMELGAHGVDVLSVAPGPVASGFAERADMRLGQPMRARGVARTILPALGRRTTIRPGFMSKFLGLSLGSLPRAFRMRIMASVMAGMTRHQDAGSARAATGSA